MNGIIKQDETDHFAIFCEKCNYVTKIKDVKTDIRSGNKCTIIHAYCQKCNEWRLKKTYWNDDGSFMS